MLPRALLLRRQLLSRPIEQRLGSQWLAGQPRRANQVRTYADGKLSNSNTKPSIQDSKSAVLPGTGSKTATNTQPPPPGAVKFPASIKSSPVTPSSDSIVPPESVPRVPPTPPIAVVQTKNAPATPSQPPVISAEKTVAPPRPPPPPPPAPKKTGRFRRFVITVVLLSGLGFAGGVYYSLVSDNFHDFFTEYVPFGEEAVLFFEEREYRRRFPNLTNPSNRPKPEQGNTITIPSKSGVSWKLADKDQQSSDTKSKGKSPAAADEDNKRKESSSSSAKDKVASTGAAVKDAAKALKPETPPLPARPPTIQPSTPKSTKATPKEVISRKETTTGDFTKPPEVNEPSKFMPITPIDPLKVENAEEPLVQDLVKILNDIITVVNNDGASYKYTSTIDKAKASLSNVGARIIGLKTSEKDAADEWKKARETEFDNGARELVRRLEGEVRNRDNQFREEFESEREKISQAYESRLKAETKRAEDLFDQRLQNRLLEQAIALKKQFLTEVTSRVETERNGRLGQLSDLSNSLAELEKLTAEWNSVLDANLRTQHMQVGVEAVKSILETTNRPSPFVRELAALKEVAANDSVISAAIASINPTAYQRGIPTTPQLIDRFRRVAAEVRKAALLPEDAGVASHAASYLLSNLLFKKSGMTVGDDVESVLTRTETLLEEGNLDDAAREMNGLKGWAKALSDDWLGECRRVLEVRQAIDVMATEARLEGLKVEA